MHCETSHLHCDKNWTGTDAARSQAENNLALT